MKAYVTFEVRANRKIYSSELLSVIKMALELDESMCEFTGKSRKLSNFTVDYVRIPIDGVKWEEENE